jgi:hypothetical protein
MKEQLVKFETAKLAKKKGFYDLNVNGNIRISQDYIYDNKGAIYSISELLSSDFNKTENNLFNAPTQSLLQKFIRETRGVHIEIHRNASGYYWGMCKEDGGTDLGWSDHSGPNMGGVWDSFEDALENASQVQLSYDLPNNTKVIKHWGNYVDFALLKIKINNKKI